MDTCLPPQQSSPFSPPPLPPPTLIFAEDSKCNNILSIEDYLWYDHAIYTEDSSSKYGGKGCSVYDRSDVGDGMNKERFNAELKKRNETHKEGETEKRVEVYGDGLLVKDEREKDRIFWETCLASGYP